MTILKKPSFYLSAIGILISFIFIYVTSFTPDPLILTKKPAPNPYPDSIAASGIIEATDRNISLRSPDPGLVIALYVKVSDVVKKGDLLFKLDDRDLLAKLGVQKANILVAKANIAKLKDQLERLESVEDIRAVSVEETKTKRSEVMVAEAELKAAQASLLETKRLIDRKYIRAPKDGVILQSNIREGEYVSVAEGDPPILLGDVERLQVRADIDEQNASYFSPDEPAYAFPKNNSQLKIPLTFERVEPYIIPKRSLTGRSDERVDTRVLQVIYSFDIPKDFQVYPGQQVDVFIKANRLNIQEESEEKNHEA
ncbi:efflux RND transporter periplasmic adaptor subunit [Criblamydia sequanensis]|uniref:HlyD family secretion protein n=1 Tax=Candidatus Criblamydia sequanensis CRIB-18 TaxID=1437425 RepID=A0A090D1D1_9BACT|nr:efflux RND transporter periplasmic adaptor subunit [Criblamydia sequanensis]CDR33473.1 HlyD family secretion protein [Criblamydia sequanensis CRIB-18]